MKVSIELKLADMWIGIYWRQAGDILHIWLCFLPCIPVHLQFAQHSVRCEACGKQFQPSQGYYAPGEYAYCSDCCHW